MQKTLLHANALPAEVSTAAAGMRFKGKNGKDCYIKKKWLIYTSHDGFREALKPMEKIPDNLKESDFVECRGKIVKASAKYTGKLRTIFWSSVSDEREQISDDVDNTTGVAIMETPIDWTTSEDGLSTCASDRPRHRLENG